MDILDLLNPFPPFVPDIGIPFLYAMLGFLLYGLWRLSQVWRSTRAFSKATATLERRARSSGSESPFPKGSADLAGLWNRFVARYRDGQIEIGGSTLGVTDPQDVFSRNAVLGRYNRHFSLALAGVFAGLGILGTFFGLYFGLKGISTQGQEELLDSVQNLLGGMSTAFLTSLVGIALSLLWLLGDRATHHALQYRATLFFEAVRTRFPVRQPESVLLEVQRLLDDQKGILQNLGTDIASAVQEAMVESFSQPLQSIDQTLQTVSTNVDSRQAEALDEMVGAFQEKLFDATGKQFDQLASAIEGAAEWQQRVNRDVQEVFKHVVSLTQMSTELVEKSTTAAERFTGSLAGLADSHERISEVTRHLHEIADRTAATSQRLGGQAEVFVEVNTELREALSHQLDQVSEQVDRLSGFWSELRGHLDGLASSLEGSVTEFTTLTQEKLQEIFSRFDSEMAAVVNHLSGTMAEIREATEELAPGVARIDETMSATLEPIRSSRAQLEALTKSILGIERLPEALDNAREEGERLRNVMERLRDAVEQADGRGEGPRRAAGSE